MAGRYRFNWFGIDLKLCQQFVLSIDFFRRAVQLPQSQTHEGGCGYHDAGGKQPVDADTETAKSVVFS